jgi:hypothetical protein
MESNEARVGTREQLSRLKKLTRAAGVLYLAIFVI